MGKVSQDNHLRKGGGGEDMPWGLSFCSPQGMCICLLIWNFSGWHAICMLQFSCQQNFLTHRVTRFFSKVSQETRQGCLTLWGVEMCMRAVKWEVQIRAANIAGVHPCIVRLYLRGLMNSESIRLALVQAEGCSHGEVAAWCEECALCIPLSCLEKEFPWSLKESFRQVHG